MPHAAGEDEDQVLGRLLATVPDLDDEEPRVVEALAARRTTIEPTGQWANFLPGYYHT